MRIKERLTAITAARPLRVVHVVRSLTTGGQEVLISRLVERLDPERFQCSVVSLLGGGWLVEALRERGIPVYCLGGREGLSPELVWRTARVLWREEADIVHCHNRTPLFYAGLASLLKPGCRLVLTKHGASPLSDSRTAPIVRLLLRRAAAAVAVSQDVDRLLREGGWVAPQRLRTVLNGVDTDLFTEGESAIRQLYGWAPEHRVIGTVARLSPEKDQATLLRAFARIQEQMPAARLLVVGDGALRPSLEGLAGELGITERTVFAGEQRHVLPFYRATDVFTLPSLTEGTSLTLLEAMACARPVVATRVGGNPEVVAEGRSGLLVPSADPEALAGALMEVLRRPEAAHTMGEAGREIVVRRYSLEAMVEAYASIYEAVGG